MSSCDTSLLIGLSFWQSSAKSLSVSKLPLAWQLSFWQSSAKSLNVSELPFSRQLSVSKLPLAGSCPRGPHQNLEADATNKDVTKLLTEKYGTVSAHLRAKQLRCATEFRPLAG